MKVTVCFGSIRVVVPCGTGELLVRDLIGESIRRYKKAAGKEPDSWVIVNHLQSQSGILDPDDRVSDVADDREQILASFDDGLGPDPGVPQGGGDGASGSSVGTGSPDIFRGVPGDAKYPDNNNDIPHIEVTGTNDHTSSSGLGLQVRRSSDPSLHQTNLNDQRNTLYNHANQQQEPTKRWSAAPVCRNDNEPPERLLGPSNGSMNGCTNGGYLSPPWESEHEESQQEIVPAFSRSGRLSMQFLGEGTGFKWMEAAEKVALNHQPSFSTKSLPRELKRKEPLGQAYESIRDKNEEMLLIINENGGPLGLTAIPENEIGGLLVQAVESGSRAERGRLRRGDRILEINGTKLIGLSEAAIQNYLRKSLSAPELRLRVLRGDRIINRLRNDPKIIELKEADEKSVTSGSTITKVATVSPTRKMPGAPIATSLQVANTRKLGRRIEISLKKGPQGLGFSVTTRDNPAGGHCPIYIKNILLRGAAIEDGNLKPGDRLLEVNGIPMTGKSQSEVVGILKATQTGATVNIVVSRQQELAEIDEREICYGTDHENESTPPKPPAPVLPQKPMKKQQKENENYFIQEASSDSAMSSEGASIFPWRSREILTLHIPVHDTEKAGLGVSVKGKTGSNNSSGSSNGSASKHDGDLGIFVKSVLNGGAASRDGRLKMNDQLLSVNGVSLLGQSNAEAMETLRRAMMHTGGNYPGMITVSVARKISRPNSMGEPLETDNSNTSEQSGKTVIYLSPDQKRDFSLDQKRTFSSKCVNGSDNKRWSNPVLDRLTGGTGGNSQLNRPSPLMTQGLRNESYYMATNDNWSPIVNVGNNNNPTNNSVLIEEDPEPTSPTSPIIPARPNQQMSGTDNNGNKQMSPSIPCDITYSSQLSLETNSATEAFSRDAVGRRSMSEKHHAALDARETGTYQRNKKLREERERERRAFELAQPAIITNVGSVESLTNHRNIKNKSDLQSEAMDLVGDLGPSLGLKKSSSLESLQTMVQEIQMSDEPRGPIALRAPRGRGREESLRAAVERPPESQPRKTWLLEEGLNDTEGGFINRHGPFQSSLNDGKHKNRNKKPGLLKGIGHMFRFGKHRKDGIAPTETLSDFGGGSTSHVIKAQQETKPQSLLAAMHANKLNDRPPGGPPMYQPPPPPANNGNGIAIHQNDLFNHRYSHYVNYDELQQQIRKCTKGIKKWMCVSKEDLRSSSQSQPDHLSESTIAQMRRQVMQQRVKVEEESRRHQHYHSQRSTRTMDGSQSHQHRPISSYYEYETVVQQQTAQHRKISAPSPPSRPQWNGSINGGNSVSGGSTRHRGPFITQVTIRDQHQTNHNIGGQHGHGHGHGQKQPASQV